MSKGYRKAFRADHEFSMNGNVIDLQEVTHTH